jgi:outer membrane protein W
MRFKKLLILCFILAFNGYGDLEIRGAYFQFANQVAKDIFSNGMPCLQLEYSRDFNPYLRVWINGDYSIKEGNSLNVGNNTTLQMGTLSIGPKFFYKDKDDIAPYVGVGLIGAWIYTNDESEYLGQNTHRGSAGIVGKFGLRYSPYKNILIDCFFDASYQPVTTAYGNAIDISTINLGGYKTGLGIEILF